MNKKKAKNRDLRNGSSIAIYLVFCMTVLVVGSVVMGGFISKNTRNQLNSILSLMSEKVDTSFSMMTKYIVQAADIVSAQEHIDFEVSYKELQKTVENMPYNTIGLIDPNGSIYGLEGEITDIENQGFLTDLSDNEGIYITQPYRSSLTGTNMITMFSPIYEKEEFAGYIFLTYYLEEIQQNAYTELLSDETSITLMNPYSGNFVNCSQDDGNPPGTWSNIRLIKSRIEAVQGYDYDKWIDNMRKDSADNIINFKFNGINYTQAYIKIDGMDNWSLVIRIPVTELSDTMGKFIIRLSGIAALLILATLLLGVSLYNREHEENETLQTLTDIDPLTKVINRRGFESRMNKLFEKKNAVVRCTFIFFDIDYFKDVNDNYGHDVGDQVLRKVAKSLSETFDDFGIVARIGGDEFNVLVTEPLSVADIDSKMANLRAELKETELDNGVMMNVTFSAGLARCPQDSTRLKPLQDCADKALYHVKETGRNNHAWYDDIK